MKLVSLVTTLFLACPASHHGVVRSHQPVLLIDSAGEDRGPSWSPDGRMVAFESDRDGNWEIYVSAADGRRQRRITHSDHSDRYPAWSPDGTRLVFVRSYDDHAEMMAVRLKDLAEQSLFRSAARDLLFPHWSPGGDELAFTRQTGNSFRLEVASIGGDSRNLLAEPGAGRDLWPRWDPGDGQRVVFFSRREPHPDDDEIYIFDRREPQLRRVTMRAGHDFTPAWSPDARRIAVAMAGASNGPALGVIDLDGRIQVTFGHGFTAVTEPSWHPSGHAIAFAGRAATGYAIYVCGRNCLRPAA